MKQQPLPGCTCCRIAEKHKQIDLDGLPAEYVKSVKDQMAAQMETARLLCPAHYQQALNDMKKRSEEVRRLADESLRRAQESSRQVARLLSRYLPSEQRQQETPKPKRTSKSIERRQQEARIEDGTETRLYFHRWQAWEVLAEYGKGRRRKGPRAPGMEALTYRCRPGGMIKPPHPAGCPEWETLAAFGKKGRKKGPRAAQLAELTKTCNN